MAAGALAGIAEHSAVYPLDLLKVLQALKDNADRAYGLQTRLQVLPSFFMKNSKISKVIVRNGQSIFYSPPRRLKTRRETRSI
ncbi:MAG: hypothetical protein LQ351_003956 [Letrouitia transgressa]|nr:MAG: hypothetical protein LQ351_003956 [Letrouitia transgressa]